MCVIWNWLCLCFASTKIILKFLECKLFCFEVFIKKRKKLFSQFLHIGFSILVHNEQKENLKWKKNAKFIRKTFTFDILERNRLKHLLLLLLFSHFKMVLFPTFFSLIQVLCMIASKNILHSIDAVTLYWEIFSHFHSRAQMESFEHKWMVCTHILIAFLPFFTQTYKVVLKKVQLKLQ